MGLSFFDSAHWAATALIEVVVLTLALRRRLFHHLPFFTIYLCLVVANEAITWTTYRINGIASLNSFYVYWTMQALQVSARALAVYEICGVLLGPYIGVWKLCRPFSLFLAIFLLGTATISNRASAHHIAATILTAERGLELMVVAILIVGLMFCRYYGLRIERYLIWIALGLGFYSAVQVANNTFLQNSVIGHFAIWGDLRHASFNIATILWLVALWKALPAARPAPVLLVSGEYESLAPQVTLRLRELNARLLEMWK
ncbi:MAG: hypothetical protein ACREDR_39020 [Blastocatellia bacterium]